MRIIEPKSLKTGSSRRWRMAGSRLMLVLLMAALAIGAWFMIRREDAAAPAGIPAADYSQPPQQVGPKQLKTFTPEQFKNLYEGTAYPNTEAITEPPVITGHAAADRRIRSIAEGRGYRLRSIPAAPINKIGDPNLQDDDLLQPRALDAWRILQAAAAKDGLPLRILSAYRSPELQRQIFLNRLSAYGVTYDQIASGQADNAVDMLLQSTSTPGYSRHHSGYTIDLQCGNGTLEAFEGSPCFAWISRNNYQVAKEAGWIPSYPAGAAKQGPEPEPWEYVWVGTEVLYE